MLLRTISGIQLKRSGRPSHSRLPKRASGNSTSGKFFSFGTSMMGISLCEVAGKSDLRSQPADLLLVLCLDQVNGWHLHTFAQAPGKHVLNQ